MSCIVTCEDCHALVNGEAMWNHMEWHRDLDEVLSDLDRLTAREES